MPRRFLSKIRCECQTDWLHLLLQKRGAPVAPEIKINGQPFKSVKMKNFLFLLLFFFSTGVFAQKKVQNLTVEAACGMCQFKVKSDKGCAMAVKIDGKIYHVEGLDKKTYGDAHAADGYCKVMKKAVVSGEIRKDKLIATSFKYVD